MITTQLHLGVKVFEIVHRFENFYVISAFLNLQAYLTTHPYLSTMSNDDEFLYHEARRINTAQFQRITYNEYHAKLVGKEWMERFRLDTDQDRYKLYFTKLLV